MTKRTAVVISKHIHASTSSWSSKDEYVNIVTKAKEIDFNIEPNGMKLSSVKFPMLNGELIDSISEDKKFIGIHLKSDTTFNYRRGLSMIGDSAEKTPEFQALVKSYTDKGFTTEKNIPSQTAFYERQRIKSRKQLKKAGVVLWMGYEAYQGHPEYFQGGFSDEVFNSPQLKKYIGNAQSVHGWIGHSQGRTKYGDKIIEKGLRKRGISPSDMYNWISSSSGRHFGDSMEDCSKIEQKEKIENELNNIYNSCLTYGCPTHKGTMNSTVDIESILNSLNILIPYGEKYNHKKHMKNLLGARKRISEHNTLTPELEYANEIITKIFLNKV